MNAPVTNEVRRSRRRLLAAPTKTGACYYCKEDVFPKGSVMALEFPERIATNDHYTPYAIAQGKHEVKIVIACARCNNIKGSTPPLVFEYFIRHTDMKLGTVALRTKYHHFTYLLMAAGLKASAALAMAARKEGTKTSSPAASPRDNRGRFTIRDLRRKA